MVHRICLKRKKSEAEYDPPKIAIVIHRVFTSVCAISASRPTIGTT